jgi:hypothetical protein
MTGDIIAERSQLMAEGNRLRAEVRVLHNADRWKPALPLRRRITEIIRRYRELLPDVTVARCTDGGELVRWPIDTFGLDGWFWRYDATISRTPEALPAPWLAMTGAMSLSEPVEETPYLAIPGPGVPFVVPRILRNPGVRAVIAQVAVGRHTGWAITYFGPLDRNTDLVNVWGTDTYPVHDDDGKWLGWNSALNKVSDYDFELAGWLASGQLLWIAPGDDSAALRSGVDDCPFVGLAGPRKIAMVEEGKVRYF